MPDMNGPVLGPVTVLARHIQKHVPVEIVGPDLGHGVCPMYRNAFPYTVVDCPRIYRYPEYFRDCRRLARAITGDIIIPVKAVADTIPVALQIKRQRKARVVPYLDEWDGALMAARSAGERRLRWRQHWHHPLEDVYYPWVERLIPQCDTVLSTSTFLQRRFGGQIVPMGVDVNFFSPAPVEQTQALRKSLGLERFRLIVFGGVVRPHKGLELIPQAVAQTGRDDLRFVIVGPINEHVKALCADPVFGSAIIAVGPQPREHMPAYLSMADLIVLPLLDTLLAQSQVPCKIFEAMAMGLPIIASAVSDMPLILKDCGWLVPPGQSKALAEQMCRVLADPLASRARGLAARQRCLEQYSQGVTERLLVDFLHALGGVAAK